MKWILFLSFSVLASCSYKKADIENQKLQGHENLYSEAEAPKKSELPKTKKRIVILSTNDWLGNFKPQTKLIRDEHNKDALSIGTGGISALSSYLKVIRQTYPEQTLLLDSGNFLPVGDFDQKIVEQSAKIFTELNYDALTLGLQDFNRTPIAGETPATALKSIIKGFKAPVLLSNMYDLKSGRVIEWQGTLPYLLKEVNGVKIGIIGLIPDDFVSLTPIQVRNGLYIEGMLQSTLRQSRLLRSLGAEVIITMTHAGITCGEAIAQELRIPLSKVNFEVEKSEQCEQKGLIADYLQRLPRGVVDILITGRTLNKTANKINGVVVMSNFGKGSSLSFTELVYDKSKKQIDWNESRIHQPLLLCHEFFKETSDCYTDDPSVDHGPRIPAQLWETPIALDEMIKLKFPLEASVHNIEIEEIKNLGDIVYYTNFAGETPIKLKINGADLFHSLNHANISSSLKDWINVELVNKSFQIKGEKLLGNKIYTLVTSLEKMEKNLYLKKYVSSPLLSLISTAEIYKDEVASIQAAPNP